MTLIRNEPYNLITNKKKSHTVIDIFGTIGWSVWIQKFASDLKKAGDVATILVRINTFGGTFFDGLPIYNLLKEHSAHVTTRNIGYAVSMGSVILLSGDTIEMADNSMTMIHRAQGYAYGDADQFIKQAGVLVTHEKAALIPLYMARLGKTEAQVKKLLQKETWYTASEALEAGLIDAISDPIDRSKAAKALKKKEGGKLSEAVKNLINPPENIRTEIFALAENLPWYANLLPSKNNDDDVMTPEQEERLIAAIKKQGSTSNEVEEVSAKLDVATQENVDLKEKTTALESSEKELKQKVTALESSEKELKQKVTALSKQKPNNNNKPPVDKPEGDIKHNC